VSVEQASTVTPLLVLSGVTKRYGAFRALDGVDFDLQPGEVHVLFGENGAGKSTLINVITGNVAFGEGTYSVQGRPAAGLSPQTLRAAGIAAVFQEFSVLPDLTVEENLFLGREMRHGPFVDRTAMRRRSAELFAELGFDIPVSTLVGSLSRPEQQMVEIAKALMFDAPILILDEPTASLTDTDADRLFAVVARLKARGVGIIYVSHRMREIRLLADRITVLRNGRRIATIAASGVTEAALVEMMAGRPSGELYPAIRHTPAAERLRIENLATPDGLVRTVSLSVHAGEIVGLAGLVGCGKSEIGRAVFGLLPIAAGSITVDGQVVAAPHPRAMLRRGVCYLPADRGTEGLALNRPVRENVTMAALDTSTLGGGGLLRLRAEKGVAARLLERLSVRPPSPEPPVLNLSGGNRQKVMLTRGLVRPTDVFLFDEPTVGIDVGAKAEVYALMRDLTEAGAAVLLVSSDLPEILHLSHRIYVMHQGVIVRELAGAERTEEAILSCFFGSASLQDATTAGEAVA
jgi:ribose transport system ATP-binding protein